MINSADSDQLASSESGATKMKLEQVTTKAAQDKFNDKMINSADSDQLASSESGATKMKLEQVTTEAAQDDVS